MKDLKITSLINNRLLAYELSSPLSIVSGFSNLLQRIAKRILTATGSNSFEPTLGTGFGFLAGTTNSNNEDAMRNNIPIMVDSLKTQLLSEQFQAEANGQHFSDEEYLLDIALKSAEYDSSYNGYIIELLITNRANNSTTLKLP